jgi:hypothetical protein
MLIAYYRRCLALGGSKSLFKSFADNIFLSLLLASYSYFPILIGLLEIETVMPGTVTLSHVVSLLVKQVDPCQFGSAEKQILRRSLRFVVRSIRAEERQFFADTLYAILIREGFSGSPAVPYVIIKCLTDLHMTLSWRMP